MPEDRDPHPVRRCAAFTEELSQLADWLRQCGSATVVLAATGVDWIPVFAIRAARGCEVLLVDARQGKQVRGRTSDVLDCPWLQHRQTSGLRSGAVRPADQIVVLRSSLRQRARRVQYAAAPIPHLQQALPQMNLLRHNVVADSVGVTGLNSMRAILAGERDPTGLAHYRDYRCKQSEEAIAKRRVGNYREEHLCALQQALMLYKTYRAPIAACDARSADHLRQLPPVGATSPPPRTTTSSAGKNRLPFDRRTSRYQLPGPDRTRIDGMEAPTARTRSAELGTAMTRWKPAKHVVSWLGLCPGTKVAGSNGQSRTTKPTANRAAAALRLAAGSLYHRRSA